MSCGLGSPLRLIPLPCPSEIARISPFLQYSCDRGTIGFWYGSREKEFKILNSGAKITRRSTLSRQRQDSKRCADLGKTLTLIADY